MGHIRLPDNLWVVSIARFGDLSVSLPSPQLDSFRPEDFKRVFSLMLLDGELYAYR
jgi:hypothetical protein